MSLLPCAWCGSPHGVKQVRRNGKPIIGRLTGVPLHICASCWGIYRETGQHRGVNAHPPDSGPVLPPYGIVRAGR